MCFLISNTLKKLIFVENENSNLVKQIILKILMYHVKLSNEWFNNNAYFK